MPQGHSWKLATRSESIEYMSQIALGLFHCNIGASSCCMYPLPEHNVPPVSMHQFSLGKFLPKPCVSVKGAWTPNCWVAKGMGAPFQGSVPKWQKDVVFDPISNSNEAGWGFISCSCSLNPYVGLYPPKCKKRTFYRYIKRRWLFF